MHRSPVTDPDRMPAAGDVSHTYRHADRRLSVAGGTRVGYRYEANFDVLHVDPVMPFVAVADGMGNGRGSTIAGGSTMEIMVSAIRAAGTAVAPDQLRAAMAKAHSRVRAAGAELNELAGCTFTSLIVTAPDNGTSPAVTPATIGTSLDRAATGDIGAAGVFPRSVSTCPELSGWIVQIGDSRAYRLRDGLLELLTVDHTAAWLGAVYGWYPADSAAAASARYQLTRYVGHPAMPEPDLLNVVLQPGDVYCVCTDGVAEQLDYQRLASRLGANAGLDEVVRGILADTLVSGGRDNATVAVLRVNP